MVSLLNRLRERLKNEKLLRYWKKNRPAGFFQIPWEEDMWSASILVKQGMNAGWVEVGPMRYIAGEAIHAWNGGRVGEYYPYSVHGVHDHEHSFDEVLNITIWSNDPLIPEEQEKYYTPEMLALLEEINRSEILRTELRFCGEIADEMSGVFEEHCPPLSYPICYVACSGEMTTLARDIEYVYQLAAQYPRQFEIPDEYTRLYSVKQRENLEQIRAYQLAALRGDAP